MNFFFERYSTDSYVGKSNKAWRKFGEQQLIKLMTKLGHSPDKGFFDLLFPMIEYKKLKRGEVVIDEGQSDVSLYFLISGGVKQMIFTPDRNWRCTNLYSAGNLFTSIPAFLLQQPSELQIVSTTPLRIFELKRNNYLQLLDSKHKEISQEIQQSIMVQYFAFTTKYQELLSLSAEEKIRQLLQNYNGIFDDFTQKDIASFCNLKAETFSRCFTKVKQEKMLA